MTIPASPAPAASPLGAADWGRDVAAATALLVSLALPWTNGIGVALSFSATRIDVLLVTILTVFGAGLTFLVRSGAFGALAIRTALLIRLGFAVPYALLVLVYVLLDAVGVVPGLGVAVGVGLAGVALIAQPRRSELAADPSAAPFAARTATAGAAVAVAAIAVLTLIGVITRAVAGSVGLDGFAVVQAVVAVLVQGAAAALLFLVVLRRSPSGRLVAWIVALASVPLVLLSVPLGGLLTSGTHGGHFLVWLLVAAGGLCSPGIDLLLPAQAPLQLWFRTARDALLVAAIASAAFTVGGLVHGLSAGANPALVIVAVVCLLAAGVAAFIARTRLVADPAHSRSAVLGLAGATAALGFIVFVLTIVVRATGSFGIIPADLLAPLLPAIAVLTPAVLALAALTLPAAVRGYAAQSAGTAPAPAPVTTALAPAADPATPAEQLAALATDPANWAALAGNPSTYPELLAYLAEHGDATVQQVLRARSLGA